MVSHFGLGNATPGATIDLVRVQWPGGVMQEFTDVASNRRYLAHQSLGLVGRLSWDGQGGGDWSDLRWLPGDTTPGMGDDVVITLDTVVVSQNAVAHSTTIHSGRLHVAGTLQIPVIVQSEGALSGGGSINGSLTNAGSHSLDDPESLNVMGTASISDAKLTVSDNYFQPSGTVTDVFTLLAATSVAGNFLTPADTGVGSHLGRDHFLQAIIYDATAVQISIFAALPGDTNGDQDVDVTDFGVLATSFEPMGNNVIRPWTMGNFDHDTDIDITDFNYLVSNFAPAGYGPVGLVPEPRPLIPLLSGFLLLAPIARRRPRMVLSLP